MKYLGQHFLKNKAAIKNIVAALDLEENDMVIEIGPGHGELTQELLKIPFQKLIAIEKDSELANQLKFEIRNSKFEIWVGNALKELPKIIYQLPAKSYKLIGNIPYYITGHLLRIISELENKPTITVLTIQKEVAERITAQPPKMNRLAAITQFWAKPKIIAHLSPSDFDPPPKVESAVIKLVYLNKRDRDYLSDRYYQMAKILFQQPRKTILNNLTVGLKISKNDLLKKLTLIGLSGSERPQELSIEKIIELSDLFR